MSRRFLLSGPNGKSPFFGFALILFTGLGACTPHLPYPPALVTPPFEKLSCAPCRKIVFTGSPDGNPDIYSINADGTELTRLTFDTAHDDFAVWSPDGTRVTYTALSDQGQGSDIWTVGADGGSPMLLVSLPGQEGQPSWSTDATKLAVASDWLAYDFVSDIFLVDPDGSLRPTATTGYTVTQISYPEVSCCC